MENDIDDCYKALNLTKPITIEQLNKRYKEIKTFLDPYATDDPVLKELVIKAAESAETAYEQIYSSLTASQAKNDDNVPAAAKEKAPKEKSSKIVKGPPAFTPAWWELNSRVVTLFLALVLAGLLAWPHVCDWLDKRKTYLDAIEQNEPKPSGGDSSTVSTTNTATTTSIFLPSEAPEVACIAQDVVDLGAQVYKPAFTTQNRLFTPQSAARAFIWGYYSLMREGNSDAVLQAHTDSWKLLHANVMPLSPVVSTFPWHSVLLPADAVSVTTASNDGAEFIIQNKYFSGQPGQTRFVTKNSGAGWRIEEESAVPLPNPQEEPGDFVRRYLNGIGKKSLNATYAEFLDPTLKRQLDFQAWSRLVNQDYPQVAATIPGTAIIRQTKSPGDANPDSATVKLDMRAVRAQTSPEFTMPSGLAAPESPDRPGLTALSSEQTIDLVNNSGKWAIFRIADSTGSYVQQNDQKRKLQAERMQREAASTDLFGTLLLMFFIMFLFIKACGGNTSKCAQLAVDFLFAILSFTMTLITKVLLPISKILFAELNALLMTWADAKKGPKKVSGPATPSQLKLNKPAEKPEDLVEVELVWDKPAQAKPPAPKPPVQKTGNPFLDNLPPAEQKPVPKTEPLVKSADPYSTEPDIEYIND